MDKRENYIIFLSLFLKQKDSNLFIESNREKNQSKKVRNQRVSIIDEPAIKHLFCKAEI
jgi:hypothetical protein